jgi:UDP-N-acetyl-D-mannosaminuronic acid dehydrogenase
MNESVPVFLVSQIRAKRPLAGAKVALLGMAFKANIDDARQSLSFKVRKAFRQNHAVVDAHDPYVPRFRGKIEDALRNADVIFLAQRHDEYRTPGFRKKLWLAKPDAIVCDLWNILATDRIIFDLSELPGAVTRPRAAAAES